MKMPKSRIRAVPFLLLALVTARPLAGQTSSSATSNASADDSSLSGPTGQFYRWLDVQAGSIGARYKRAKESNGPWIYQVQYQFFMRGRIKFDRRGHYYAGFRLSTGKVFSYSWNSTGAGDGDFAANVYSKELFFSASPSRTVEIQFGGIGINRGESTEVTGYSNNGYLMGERITLRRPDRLFFDEISATGAYLGDQEKPGVFQRVHRLGKMNYRQFQVSKRLHEQMSVSADYSFRDGIETLRQAFKLYLLKSRFVDSIVFENYQRLDSHPAWGYAITVQKTPARRLALTGGFVHVDRYFADWNADKLGRGKRVFVNASYNFWREFSANLFAGKAFSNDFAVINAARYDIVIAYDFLKALRKAGLL
jgi:hypothetical protein